MALLLTFALLSILVSFLCSILEAVLLSITPTFVNVAKQDKKDWAEVIERLKKDIDEPLIAILTLNTVAHTVGAIGVGATAEAAFGTGNNVVGIVSAVMTIAILVFSEIIPKTLGATYWKALAPFAARTLQAIIFPLKWTGILWVLRLTTKLIGHNTHGSVFSREDFGAMAELAHEEGVFKESERNLIKNLLSFEEVLAEDIMTPRSVMKIADGNESIQAFFEANPQLRFSRIPVYEKNTDDIHGMVLKHDILEAMVRGEGERPLKSLLRKVDITTATVPVPQLFELLIEKKSHMALVYDRFGSVSGLVTMEDIIETLLGLEIMDESDKIADLQTLARKNWKERALRLGIVHDWPEEEPQPETDTKTDTSSIERPEAPDPAR